MLALTITNAINSMPMPPTIIRDPSSMLRITHRVRQRLHHTKVEQFENKYGAVIAGSKAKHSRGIALQIISIIPVSSIPHAACVCKGWRLAVLDLHAYLFSQLLLLETMFPRGS
mmetsp:Transcript_3663/g.9246  ORF Transcript_3663/g.9246 Transcript_3663/m.9246 type:complete len:114 (+) Transcript_3663:585-926(+)